MMRIIAVCLKEEAKVPIIGCAMLNNTSSVDKICCVDENDCMKVIEVSPDDFTNNIMKSMEEDVEPAFSDYTFDTIKNNSVKALRSVKGTILFKKSMRAVFLAELNNVYYIWFENKYYAIKPSTVDYLSKLDKHRGKKGKLEITKEVYNLFLENKELKSLVRDSMLYMVNELDMEYEKAQNFIIDTFNYTSKSMGVTMNKNRLKNLLGLDAKGESGKQNLNTPMEIEEDKTVDLNDYVDGLDNVDVTQVNSAFCPKEIDLSLITNVKDDISEKCEEYAKEYDYEIQATSETDDIGNQEIVEVKEDTKAVVNDIVDSVNNSEFDSGDPNCSKCGGKGYYLEDNFGIPMKIKCSCVDRYRELKSSKEGTVKGSIKLNKGVSNFQAMILGLIPRRRINDLLDFREMGDRIGKICSENGEKIKDKTEYEVYKNTMRNILGYLLSNKDLDYSVLLSSPNGFGKTTFVYTCLKLLLMNGRKVAPFVSLFELAQLRLDYMESLTWRQSEITEMTDSEKNIFNNGSYNGRLRMTRKKLEKAQEENNLDENTEVESTIIKPFVDMSDSEKDMYIMNMKNTYTYKDYLDCDLLFCQLSVAEQSYLEISTLKSIMDYRGLKCKATVIVTDRDIEVYKTSQGMATDVHLLNEMLTKELKYATYDRALSVSVKKERGKKLKVKAGENV